MTKQEIFEELKPLLVEVLGVAPEKVRLESVLVSDLGAESIDLLDLSFRIEEKF
jgi:acyl carrier protein